MLSLSGFELSSPWVPMWYNFRFTWSTLWLLSFFLEMVIRHLFSS